MTSLDLAVGLVDAPVHFLDALRHLLDDGEVEVDLQQVLEDGLAPLLDLLVDRGAFLRA